MGWHDDHIDVEWVYYGGSKDIRPTGMGFKESFNVPIQPEQMQTLRAAGAVPS